MYKVENAKKKKLFEEIHLHLLEDQRPSEYLSTILLEPLFSEYPFSMIKNLTKAEQSPVHHPEGNAWKHTLLVVDEAARRRKDSKEGEVFMWAALLHDIGKPVTTRVRKGKITSYDHDRVGAKMSKEFLSFFSCEENFIEKVSALVRYHMHILYIVKDLSFGNIKDMKENTDVNELALLGLCDRLGRLKPDREIEEENIKLFLNKVQNRR
ncbi:phosphohydrolase [Anaerocolumna cellulosilytica]|uniref:Phosphohydrolase n=1 Tax=Anaerocolumna cellulosilytica TaxID=433286 RepID=A0A6S6QVY0_9FIRM|nr:phosphohydrolase [Anaerocolumna cellulosilytica]